MTEVAIPYPPNRLPSVHTWRRVLSFLYDSSACIADYTEVSSYFLVRYVVEPAQLAAARQNSGRFPYLIDLKQRSDPDALGVLCQLVVNVPGLMRDTKFGAFLSGYGVPQRTLTFSLANAYANMPHRANVAYKREGAASAVMYTVEPSDCRTYLEIHDDRGRSITTPEVHDFMEAVMVYLTRNRGNDHE